MYIIMCMPSPPPPPYLYITPVKVYTPTQPTHPLLQHPLLLYCCYCSVTVGVCCWGILLLSVVVALNSN